MAQQYKFVDLKYCNNSVFWTIHIFRHPIFLQNNCYCINVGCVLCFVQHRPTNGKRYSVSCTDGSGKLTLSQLNIIDYEQTEIGKGVP